MREGLVDLIAFGHVGGLNRCRRRFGSQVEEAVDEAPSFAARDRVSLRAFWVREPLVAAFVWRGAEA